MEIRPTDICKFCHKSRKELAEWARFECVSNDQGRHVFSPVSLGWETLIADILFKHHYPNMPEFLPRDSEAIKEIADMFRTKLAEQKQRMLEALPKEIGFVETDNDAGWNDCREAMLKALEAND